MFHRLTETVGRIRHHRRPSHGRVLAGNLRDGDSALAHKRTASTYSHQRSHRGCVLVVDSLPDPSGVRDARLEQHGHEISGQEGAFEP